MLNIKELVNKPTNYNCFWHYGKNNADIDIIHKQNFNKRSEIHSEELTRNGELLLGLLRFWRGH